MQITQIQIRLVRRSFGLASIRRKQVAQLFFDRLFELDPALRPMFDYIGTEIQGERVLRMLALLVNTLDDRAVFEPEMKAMGQRHIVYGVRKDHYKTFSEALLWALEKCLGGEFTPAMREAWRVAIDVMARTATENQDSALI